MGPAARVSFLAFPLLLAVSSAADDEKPASRIVASERVVRLVVDAYVTDAKGNPITDLVPSDFRVLADGKPLEVESAEFVGAGTAEGPVTPPPAPDGVGGNAAAPAPAPYPPGRLIVLFVEGDIGRQRTKGLMRVKQELYRLLDRLQPTDRGRRFFSHLTVLTDFTSDRAVLDEAFRQGLARAATPTSRSRRTRRSPRTSISRRRAARTSSARSSSSPARSR